MDNISQIDWARLAAYIDGEGCISIEPCVRTNRKKNLSYRVYVLYVCVTNTDFRIPHWCQRLFGGSVKYREPDGRTRRKPISQWVVCTVAAEEVLRGCLPYFIAKKEQAEIGLAFRETYDRREHIGSAYRPIDARVIELREALTQEIADLKERPDQRIEVGA